MKATFHAIAVIALGAIAAAPAAGSSLSQTQQGNLVSKAEYGLSSNKAGESTGFRIHLSHELSDGAKPPQAVSLEVTTARGTKVNGEIAGTCDFTELQNTGSCPSNTAVGTGNARARVDSGGIGILEVGSITPYKIANSNCGNVPGSKLCIAIHAAEETYGVVTNIIVGVTGGSQPKLVAKDFGLPEVLGVVPVLIDGDFSISKSKKIKGKKTSILTNPKKCSGSWTIAETRDYVDLGPVTTNTKIPCKKGKAKKK